MVFTQYLCNLRPDKIAAKSWMVDFVGLATINAARLRSNCLGLPTLAEERLAEGAS
jgi:hypothetical protein